MSRQAKVVSLAGGRVAVERRDFSPAQEAARDAEEAAWATRPPEQAPPDPLAELLIEKGAITRQEWDAKQAGATVARR